MEEQQYDPDSGTPGGTTPDPIPSAAPPSDERAIKYEAISVQVEPEPDILRFLSSSRTSHPGVVVCVVVGKPGKYGVDELSLTWDKDVFTITPPLKRPTKTIAEFFELEVRREIGEQIVKIMASTSDSDKKPTTTLYIRAGSRPEEDVVTVLNPVDATVKKSDLSLDD